MAKEKVLWPSWRFGPNGQKQIFQAPEEVPEGWADHPSKVSAAAAVVRDGEQPDLGLSQSLASEQRSEADFKKKVEQLAENKSQDELAGILEAINEGLEEKDQIEFLAGWPKVRLATLIVKHNEG